MTASIRQRLPNRRQCESFEFRHAGHDFMLAAGFYPDGRIAEIFLSSHKPGSPIEAIARDAAVTVSIALQFGVPIETIRAALTKDHDGSAATVLGAALDALADGRRPSGECRIKRIALAMFLSHVMVMEPRSMCRLRLPRTTSTGFQHENANCASPGKGCST
jgi:hypothetical protein